jgi:hypothetical protein
MIYTSRTGERGKLNMFGLAEDESSTVLFARARKYVRELRLKENIKINPKGLSQENTHVAIKELTYTVHR